MWLGIPVALIFKEQDYWFFLLSGAITLAVGLLAYIPLRKTELQLNRRDGYVIVTGAWILFSLFGTLPFLLMVLLMHSSRPFQVLLPPGLPS